MEEQHGFRPNQSTFTCNLIFSFYILNAFQKQSQVDVIYNDFNKTFDSVYHDTLIIVLKQYGFGEPLLPWLSSYLVGRYQWVSHLALSLK